MKALRTSYEAGDELEKGVLAEFQRKPSATLLRESYRLSVQTLARLDEMATKLKELRVIEQRSKLQPEFEAALGKILADHPPVERVSTTDTRFANIARGSGPVEHTGPIGTNLDEIITNIETDLDILRAQQAETNEAFRAVLPVAEHGGFAAMVLSGRAPFPERVMQNELMVGTFTRFYTQACFTTIAATMQVYPKGLEYLPAPTKK
jgi:hypothetical protein